MTSLPISQGWPESPFGETVLAAEVLAEPAAALLEPENLRLRSAEEQQAELNHEVSVLVRDVPSTDDRQFLLGAFRTFSQAAVSLENSYRALRLEVERLRRELEQSNAGLARSLEQNRSMRAHLDRILESLPCGVLVVAGGGEIVRANPEAARLLGFVQCETSPRAHIRALPQALAALLESAREGKAEAEIRLCDGVSRWLSARHARVEDGGGKDAASVFIFEDVSEARRLEQARQKLRREQALGEMSAMLAHEIRNPLGSLELFAGLLAESSLEEEAKGWVEHVQAGLRTLSATVNNVLQFYSLPEADRAPLDCGQLLAWAEGFFQPLAGRENIEVICQNSLDRVELAADRHLLEQVLLNLVLNAIRATPAGGCIRVTGKRVGDTVSVAVADSGPGIAPELVPRIFEAGFSTKPGSPGLGLAVCRRIAEQHGGRLTVESARPGGGATFTLSLPVFQQPNGAGKP